MFLSLSKKVTLLITLFFLICFGMFGYTLYNIYNSKLQEDQQVIHLRNQQYNELLFRYNKLKTLIDIRSQKLFTEPDDEINSDFFDREDARYQSLLQNLYMIIACLGMFCFFIVLMLAGVHKMILIPVAYFNRVSQSIQRGIYSMRLKQPHKIIHDEFNILEQTYNRMLENIENQIQQIQEQTNFLQKILDGIPDAIRVLDFKS